jgi:hypothetical protein
VCQVQNKVCSSQVGRVFPLRHGRAVWPFPTRAEADATGETRGFEKMREECVECGRGTGGGREGGKREFEREGG